ncbi:small ribosomal subunit protein uS2-like [Lagenorhynchus albirostris]|uniref:small ribosomal subunit protein uS2-like n=1 Tax=Lagenorhynchus albirostris TaxID=27610 RepID=UPI0028EED452|nr:small ribosomal subunit protein uS2-like [Lagenorhynchus albirostris]
MQLPFPCQPDRGPYGVVLYSHRNLKGNFHNVRSLDVLQMKEKDVLKFLAAETHLGGTNLDFQMEQYIYKRKSDGIYIINLKGTWEKLLLEARAIVAIENPADVSVISSRNTGQRAGLKFAAATGATPITGCFTPGTFTNQIQAAFREPRLLVITDPRADHQPLTGASYANLTTIALCNADSPLRYVDIAIPCNNKGAHSVGLMWWMLAWEVLRMRGTISREHPWEVMPDLYFYRDPEEIEKGEQAAAEKAVAKEEFQGEWTAPAPEFTATQPEVADWSEGVQVPSVPIQQFSTEDWSAQPATEDWSAAPTAQAIEWVGTTTEWSETVLPQTQNGNRTVTNTSKKLNKFKAGYTHQDTLQSNSQNQRQREYPESSSRHQVLFGPWSRQTVKKTITELGI